MISVICARPEVAAGRYNPGMLAVDLAGHRFLHRHFPEAGVRHFVLGGLPDLPGGDFGLPFRYEDYTSALADVMASDLILFWGDFTHAHTYHRVDLRRRGVPEALIRSHLFLEEGGDDVLRRTVVFGATLMSDLGIKPEPYRVLAGRFFSGAAGVFMRDPVSDFKTRTLTGRFDITYQGVDCALLLDDDLLASLPAREEQGNIGIFFSRTQLNLAQFFAFANRLAALDHRKLLWLPWIPPTKIGEASLDRNHPRLRRAPSPATFSDALALVRACDYVITDTYHLALIAWRLGVPAICIGEGGRRRPTTLDDKKKEICYSLYGAENFYLFAERFADAEWRAGAVTRVRRLLRDGIATAAVRAAMLAHAAAAEKALCSCLACIPAWRRC
jgi:hypothetical protein